MNNKILAVRRPSPLVRVWRSTGDPGMPLVGIWVQADTAWPFPVAMPSRAIPLLSRRMRSGHKAIPSAGCPEVSGFPCCL